MKKKQILHFILGGHGSEWICPQCGTENMSGRWYCGLCGRLCEDKTKISSKLLKKLKRVV